MMEKLALTVAYLMLTGAVAIVLRPFRQASPVFWFPVALTVMALGTIALINPSNNVDLLYIFLHFVAMISFVVPALLYLHKCEIGNCLNNYKILPFSKSGSNARAVVIGMFAFCVFITIVYYIAVGYNMMFLLFSGSVGNDYSDLRIASYSGDEYFAPGYVNQFKNILLPISAVCIAVWIRESRSKMFFYVFLAISIPFVVVALAGTGQRAFIVYTAASLSFGFILHNIGRRIRINPAVMALIFGPILALFAVMTIPYYGRQGGDLGSLAADILSRLTSIQQDAALVGFHYVHMLDIVWFKDWAQALIGIIPGQEGSRIAHEVHAIMYGSDRGTAPLSNIGSAYHNGGIITVILLHAVMGWSYAALYRRFLVGPRTIIRSISYGFIFFYLTIFIGESPASLIDNGVLTAALFLFLVSVVERRQQRPIAGLSRVGGSR
jgi:hypothetical protein